MTISIYAAGGCGVNVGKLIKDLDVNITFVDTSLSNLKAVNSPNVFLVEGMDGAGKNRSVAYENFKDISEDVLLKHPPSEQLNIVICSLSGGSGSILAPMITKELLARSCSVIVVAIDSKHSVIEMSNSLKTLKTFKSIADKAGKPVSLFHIENSNRGEADRQAIHFVNLLSLLTDKKVTEEFDNSDLKSFLYFDKVTDNAPTLSILEVVANDNSPMEKGTSIVGSILITKNRGATLQANTPEYLATCIVNDSGYNNEDIRLNSVLGKLSILLTSLEKEIQTHQDLKKVNKIKDVELTGSNADGVHL
jgi:hypothetical protein